MTSGCAAPVSPHTACRLSRTARIGHAGLLGDAGGHARQQARHGEMGDVGGLHAGRLEQVGQRRRHDLVVALVPDPALLPGVVELEALAAEVIDEIHRAARMPDQPRHHRPGADEQRRRAVARLQLQRARRLGAPLLRGHHEDRPGPAARHLQRRHQPRGGGALRGGEVLRVDAGREIQRLQHDAGVQPVLEREAGGGERQRGDGPAVLPGEAVARRLHGHGHRVLVPVAHGALALGEALERGVEPGVGVGHRLAGEAEPREVGAVGQDADGRCLQPSLEPLVIVGLVLAIAANRVAGADRWIDLSDHAPGCTVQRLPVEHVGRDVRAGRTRP